MKKKLLIGVGLFLGLGGAAFMVVGSAGVPKPIDPTLRGTPEYLTSETVSQVLPSITSNIQTGSEMGGFAKIEATCEFRHGDELSSGEAVTMFTAADARLKDAFIMLLSTKTPDELKSAEQLNILKTEMKKRIQQIVFPEKRAVVENILFREFRVQQ